ncbi:MAG TPA: 2-hydroxychromene-2-carboxylate isomerase [Burkholderiales bacterium]|nr:2-hydroxychromene-2-carboxylate isomerase [Burkholderiales bacterium]
MRFVDWYFDFISPYSHLCLYRLKALPADVSIRMRPVLFAGLLNNYGQKGPAEIPAKRLWTYRSCVWLAQEHGVPLRFPALHPFNSLHHLRLCLAAGGTEEAIRAIFDEIWTTGADAADPARFKALCRKLDVQEADLGKPEVKDQLKRNGEDAIAAGVFGVPSFVVDGEVFWGADSIDFLNAYLADPAVLGNDEMKRVADLPVGAARKA